MKRIYRLQRGKMICGVCAGIGEYFQIDPNIIRLLFVLFALCGGSGLLFYIAAAVILPEYGE